MVDNKQQWKAWLYLAPAIILLLLFTVWPIVNTLRMAFLNGYSVADSNKTLTAGKTVTLYGDFAFDGDNAIVQNGARFVDEDAVFIKEGSKESATQTAAQQNDLIDEIKHLRDGETLGRSVGLTCSIKEVVKDYNNRTRRATFYAEIKDGRTKLLTILCQNVRLIDYEFGLSSAIYVTGNVTKTDDQFVPYTLTNATYTTEYELSSKQRNGLENSKADILAQVAELSNGQSLSEQVTLPISVYSLDSVTENSVNMVCQAINGGQEFLFRCEELSATEQSGLSMDGFHFGVKNFQKVVNYAQFGTCLKNTMLLCVLTVPLSTLLALVISVCLNAIKPLQKLLQTIYFIPYVTNSIAIGMVFATMFNMVGYQPGVEPRTIGVINSVLEAFGGTRINWINAGSSYAANVAVMVIYIVWNALPFKILILLGGLQSVNKQYYDAAKVDGTSKWRTFWRITVPLLSPMISYVLITGFIGGFKEYSSIVGVFGETMGPPADPVAGGSLNTMVGYIYNAISDNQGRASAASLILFGIIMVVTLINLKVSNKRVHY